MPTLPAKRICRRASAIGAVAIDGAVVAAATGATEARVLRRTRNAVAIRGTASGDPEPGGRAAPGGTYRAGAAG